MATQEEICKAIIALGKAADAIDDGYHGYMTIDIITMRNYLFNELDSKVQEKFKKWQEGRTLGGRIIEEV